jgi:hypothetical protein
VADIYLTSSWHFVKTYALSDGGEDSVAEAAMSAPHVAVALVFASISVGACGRTAVSTLPHIAGEGSTARGAALPQPELTGDYDVAA